MSSPRGPPLVESYLISSHDGLLQLPSAGCLQLCKSTPQPGVLPLRTSDASLFVLSTLRSKSRFQNAGRSVGQAASTNHDSSSFPVGQHCSLLDNASAARNKGHPSTRR